MLSSSDISRKILVCVIDGNASHREQIALSLTSFYTVADFGDGTAALEAMRALPPMAIILDEAAPPDGGPALLARIKATPELAHIHVILVAERSESSLLHAALPEGADACLIKPFRRSALLKAISQQVNGTVEEAWSTLEPVQKAALEKTVGSFLQISDMIEEGTPLPYGEVRESCEPLVQAVRENRYKDILDGVKGHDNYSFVHSLRVATLLSLFGHKIGIQGEQLNTLATGGLLHDVGKMSIPFEVLNKPGRLEGDDLAVMRSHVTRTIEFLSRGQDIPHGVMVIAAQHHEKLDGTGYPFGLKGDELNELARMAAIVDIFGALTDRRVYKPPMPPDQAILLMRKMGGEIDEHLLALFADMLLDAAV